MRKRIVLGLAAAAAVAATAVPAAAHYEIMWCMPTAPHPCGICIEEAGVRHCQPF